MRLDRRDLRRSGSGSRLVDAPRVTLVDRLLPADRAHNGHVSALDPQDVEEANSQVMGTCAARAICSASDVVFGRAHGVWFPLVPSESGR